MEGEDPTCTENELSTEADRTSRRRWTAGPELRTSSPSMAPTPSLTVARGGGRSTCRCGSRGPTSCANVARWQVEKSCSAVLRRTPSRLPPPPTTRPPSPRKPARLTCLSLPCLWGCLSLSLRCPSPSPSPSRRRLSPWLTWVMRKQGALITGARAGAGTGWPASAGPVRDQRRARGTDDTGTATLGPKPKAWTSPKRHTKCCMSDDRSARRGRSWTRGKRKTKERRSSREKEGPSKTTGHASSTLMQKLENTVEGELCSHILLINGKYKCIFL